MKPYDTPAKKAFVTTVCILGGNLLLAFLVAAFIIPHDIIMGGTTGIGIVLNHIFPQIDVSLLILILNVILLLTGLIILGVMTILGLITFICRIFDAVTDPWIASLSDRSKNPKGRRIPFMKRATVPFAVVTVLVFFAPV